MINQIVSQRYEVLEKVGESPIFHVYKARDRVSSRIVALKMVTPAYVSDVAFCERLRSVTKAVTELEHAHIARTEEVGEHEGILYLVTEYVRGINLRERIRRIAPFTLSVAVDFACAIAEAMHYAHGNQQPHGDLRPQNIIISPEGAVKITDFGVQRAAVASLSAQREMLSRMAPYLAPENTMTQPGTVVGDVYAVGAILYEMLTGTPVYVGDTPAAIAKQHAYAEIPSPRAINMGVPRSVEGIIVKCLQKRPELRYSSMTALLNDLKSVRDALRFGKPLSWSPIDIEAMRAAPEHILPTAATASTSSTVSRRTATSEIPEPVAEAAASSQAILMPQRNTMRAQDERVSIYIKAALAAVTVVIIFCLAGFVFIWAQHWSPPKPVTIPNFVGKNILEARKSAESLKIRLIEHGEFSADKPRNVIYKMDRNAGATIQPNHVINIWYSKGSKFVDVPSVKGLIRDEAEQKLKDAGLTIGTITEEFSDTVPYNAVIRQTGQKRVQYDTPIDLVLSKGPKEKPNEGNVTLSPEETPRGFEDAPETPPAIPETELTKTFYRVLIIKKDGKGIRRVRVEYKDDRGPQPPVLDEYHDEGDRIPVRFDYAGNVITIYIYYDDQLKGKFTVDPQRIGNQPLQGQ